MVASAAVTCHSKSLWQGCSVAECYDLSLNRTKELVHGEILQGIEELEGVLR